MRTKTRTSSVTSLHTNVSIALSRARQVLGAWEGVEVGLVSSVILPCTQVTKLASPVREMVSGLRQWLVGTKERATA